MSSPRHRSYSRSSSYSRRRHRSPSYDRHDKYERRRKHERRYRERSPRRSPPRGISNPPKGHPESNPGNNLYISNLHEEVNETDLKGVFAKFGEIKDVRIVRDPVSRDSRGFGFVTFEDITDAEQALSEMDSHELRGKHIRVEKARRCRPHESTPGSYHGPIGASSKYRERRRRSPSY